MIVRNIRIAGRRTSVRLEQLEIEALDRICATENLTIHEFCERAEHDPARIERNRSNRIRMAILAYYKAKAEGRAGKLSGGVGDTSLSAARPGSTARSGAALRGIGVTDGR